MAKRTNINKIKLSQSVDWGDENYNEMTIIVWIMMMLKPVTLFLESLGMDL
jgi:hypothetical protein